MHEAGWLWDCRWPDPVALRVANQRLLDSLDPGRGDLNLEIPVTVDMEGMPAPGGFPHALLITPWAVERVFWSPFGQTTPSIVHAMPLEVDEAGRVAAGQGVLLLTEPKPTPVLIAWEPETGHVFIQSLLADVRSCADSHEAVRLALTGAAQTMPARQGQPAGLQKTVSRRGMFSFLR